MDESIKMILESFGSGLKNYSEKLGPDNKAFQKFKATYDSVAALASQCSDINTFYSRGESLLTRLNEDFAAMTREKPIGGIRRIPSASETAAGYHLAYKALEKRPELVRTHALYQRVFEIEKQSGNALEFLACMAEENLFALMSSVQMDEEMETVRKGGEASAQPHVREYSKAMKEALKKAESTTWIELAGEQLGLVHMLNGNFDNGYLQITSRILGAISDWDTTRKEEERAIAEHVYRTAADFYGVDFDRAVRLPRNEEFLRKSMFGKLDRANLAQKGIHSYEDWIESFRKMLFQEILKGKPEIVPAKENGKVRHFGRDIVLEDIPADYSRFPFGLGDT